MSNDQLVRNLIRGSVQRAVQETVAGLIVLVFITIILKGTAVGSPAYYGCLLVLVGTGVIIGVVWSYALTGRTIRTHSPADTAYWRQAFAVQARLLRLVPLWYCAPLFTGGVLFVLPRAGELVPFLMVTGLFTAVFALIIWLNRTAASHLDAAATQLT